ncbi:BTAD domain-containing putative transcriptional regulator [Micromonospora sp. DT53]|uniref:AfsR/SARP family transcriptional regulator n=1 Tax=Micromonospora sp. DT53 TaxID=3393444 RepID=UPI003CED9394
MRFTILGGVRAWRGEDEVDLGARQPRLMAAMLLARAGQQVAVSELVDLLWGADPPPTAVNVVHRHIGAIRRVIEPGLARRAEGDWLVRSAGGYRISVPSDSVDLLLFREKAAYGAAELTVGRTDQAIDAYQEALALWHGRFGEGLGVDTHPLSVAVNRERAVIACAAADAALNTPRAASLLPALHAAAAAEPFDEALEARLLLLLGAAGRPGEAIGRYHRFRERLVADFGMGPGRELVAAFERVLREPQDTDPVRAVAPVPAVPVPAPPVRSSAPAQLPPGLALFTGRRNELAELDRMLEEGVGQQHGAAVLALDGMLGVGKTTLAAYWAHRVADRFTDGQLFLNLREFGDGEPMSTAEALAQLLSGLGMTYDELPPTVEARVAQFRTLTAGRKLLILLDDVRDADQVRPLIPASSGSLVLVTSRGRLTSLAAADGALLLGLEVPPAADAREMLLARLTLPSPAGREDEATLDTVLDRAGRLPLALAIIAARMSEYAPRPLRDLAGCMAEKHGLDGFVGDDADSDMRTVLDRSYRRLSPEAGRMLRRLSGADAEVAPDVAAELVGVTRSSATTLLSELVRAGLLIRSGFSRYAMHPLVRAYAAELAAQTVKRRRLHLVRAATSDDLRYAGMAAG